MLANCSMYFLCSSSENDGFMRRSTSSMKTAAYAFLSFALVNISDIRLFTSTRLLMLRLK